jgi:hypothetical protein
LLNNYLPPPDEQPFVKQLLGSLTNRSPENFPLQVSDHRDHKINRALACSIYLFQRIRSLTNRGPENFPLRVSDHRDHKINRALKCRFYLHQTKYWVPDQQEPENFRSYRDHKIRRDLKCSFYLYLLVHLRHSIGG